MERLPLAEFRRLDLNAAGLGVPVARLMGRAGKALVAAVLEQMGSDGHAWFLCGKGNNGGDGCAAAALLVGQGRSVRVLLMTPPGQMRGAPRAYLDALPKEVVHVWDERAPRQRPPAGTVLVDCLLGSGFAGAPRPPYDAALRWLAARRRAGHAVVACDLPSALGHRLAVVPTVTVTFHAAKQGMTRRNSGRIVVADIGIPAEAVERIGLGDLDAAMGPTDPDAHKGDNGRVLIVGGGPFLGAPWYSAMGAARSGADLVHIATPAEAARTIAAWGPTPLVHATEPGAALTTASLEAIEALLDQVDALVLGPGLGAADATRKAAAKILTMAAGRKLPVVVDADGLDAVTPSLLRRHGRHMVLTPHKKEFEDLAGETPDDARVVAYAGKHGVTVLRKGRIDLVTDGTTTRRCHCGHPAMAVGGTGDVLAGAVGAMLARGASPLQAASAAAYLVGTAGEVAASFLGLGTQATDVHEAIPTVLTRLG